MCNFVCPGSHLHIPPPSTDGALTAAIRGSSNSKIREFNPPLSSLAGRFPNYSTATQSKRAFGLLYIVTLLLSRSRNRVACGVSAITLQQDLLLAEMPLHGIQWVPASGQRLLRGDHLAVSHGRLLQVNENAEPVEGVELPLRRLRPDFWRSNPGC